MDEPVFVYGGESFFRIGFTALSSMSVHFIYLQNISAIFNENHTKKEKTYIILVPNLSVISEFVKFNTAIEVLKISGKIKIGILLSKQNHYISYYFYRKLNGKVDFFDASTATSGKLYKEIKSWCANNTRTHVRAVHRFKDKKYGIPLTGWFSLIIPLCGESIENIAENLSVSTSLIYQARSSALRRMGLGSYNEFCHMFFNGHVKIEILPLNLSID
ncbi:hypothetical protein NP681_004483 [Salmonella enterica]|nr:hypothetical protein [Salmonella enterica]EJR3519424.1 hypothetical protein [Salmonella enterica]